MKFDASHNEKYDNIVICGWFSAEYVNDMFKKTKNVVKYTGIVPNGVYDSELNEELQNLKSYSLTELKQLKNTLVIIAYSTSSSIIKEHNNLLNMGLPHDHISNYTNKLDVGILSDLDYSDYTDFSGNHFVCESKFKHNSCVVYKCNSECSGNKISIGEQNLIYKKLEISVWGKNGTVHLGNHISYVQVCLLLTTNGIIKIGDYCLFSHPIIISQTDQHHIFDLNTRKCLNLNKTIFIGNHVWIGRSANILGGAEIPDNCIVGSNAVTSHKFKKPNCIIAGNPAKVIKEDIIWARDDLALNYTDYSECEDQMALKYLQFSTFEGADL